MSASLLPCYRDRSHVDQLFALERHQRSAKVKSAVSGDTSEGRWVQMELPFYEKQFTTSEALRVCVTTFNVGCKKPPSDVSPLVSKVLPSDGLPVDLVIVGFQEVDMSAAAMWKVETEAATPWVVGLMSELGAEPLMPPQSPAVASPAAVSGAAAPITASNFCALTGESPYVMLPPKQLVGLLLCAFVRRALLPHVDEVQIATTATGALGSVGNKGGVGLSLKIHMTSLCVLTAHLAAGQSHTNKRNEDILTILNCMDFNAARRQAALNSSLVDMSEILPPKLPKDHDTVLVAGDLNYRVDLSYEAAVALAVKDDIPALLKEDQLVKELKSPHTPWRGFTDLLPTFRPTYRYDMGTNTYDTSEKKRIPSFTDRILHWSKQSSALSSSTLDVVEFQALQQVMSSDHKPVRLLGKLSVRVVVPEKQALVVEMLKNKVLTLGLDRVSQAKTTVSAASLDFGIQEFHHCGAQRSLTVTNQGDCTASVRMFRQQAEASQGMWLRVTPSSLDILPGETVEINVQCIIDKQSLQWVALWLPHKGQASVRLKSNLVMHVFGGSVHLVECVTVVQPSVFGNTLDNIVRLESTSCMDAYASSSPPNVAAMVNRPRLPKELWYLCDAIYKRGLKFPGLLTEASSNISPECAEIMAFLDRNNKPLPEECAIDAVGSCLLLFLSSLQEPVIPSSQYANALSSIRTGGKVPLFFVQQQLPPLHANVFLYVVSLVNFMLRPQYSQYNELTPPVAAQVLAQIMMPRPTHGAGGVASSSAAVGHVDPNDAAGAGITPQQLRHVIQQDTDDSVKFMLYFLTPPPTNMQS